MAYVPKAPFGIFDRAAYKNAFIDKFGVVRWEKDHEGIWENMRDPATGKYSPQVRFPDMPLDVYQWLREIGWPVGLWSHVATRMTNDLGSTAQLYTESFKADAANTGQAITNTAKGVAKTSSKFALGAVCAFLAVVAVIYKDEIQAVLK